MTTVPRWQAKGDWFNVCKCSIPCPCEFAQPPTFGDCDGILVWHIREGTYGGVGLGGFSVLALAAFPGQYLGGRQGDHGHLHR